MRDTKVLAIALEAVGMCIVLGGIVVEVSMHADAGFVAITAGSLIVMGGGLLWAKIIGRHE